MNSEDDDPFSSINCTKCINSKVEQPKLQNLNLAKTYIIWTNGCYKLSSGDSNMAVHHIYICTSSPFIIGQPAPEHHLIININSLTNSPGKQQKDRKPPRLVSSHTHKLFFIVLLTTRHLDQQANKMCLFCRVLPWPWAYMLPVLWHYMINAALRLILTIVDLLSLIEGIVAKFGSSLCLPQAASNCRPLHLGIKRSI